MAGIGRHSDQIFILHNLTNSVNNENPTALSYGCLLSVRFKCFEGVSFKHIPEEVRIKNPEVPWKEMAGIRDVLAHDYFGVDEETVWLTAKEKTPQLIPSIK